MKILRKTAFPRFLINALMLFLLALTGAQAGDFGEKGNTEIFDLTNWKVDAELKDILIRRAKTSIQFVGFSQNTDKIGLPFLSAIRSAQMNGVKVEGIYDWQVSQADGNKNNEVKAFLTDPSLPCPADLFCAHPIEKLSSGVSISDYVHEKMVIIDAGTEEEVIFFSGRWMTESSSSYIDSGFLVRRIKSGVPYIGDDMKSLFGSLRDSLKKMAEKSVYKISMYPNRVSKVAPIEGRFNYVATAAERGEVAEILNVLRKPAVPLSVKEMKPFQFQLDKVSLFSNDLFAQILEGKEKRENFVNAIHAEMIKDLKSMDGTARMVAYSFGPSRPYYAALVEWLRRGNTLEVFANGAKNFQLANASFRDGFPAYYTYEIMLKLMKDIRGSKGQIKFFVLNADRAKEMGLSHYLHRKQFLLRNQNKSIVYNGSDNLTHSAATKNDEMMVRIEDRRFVARMVDTAENESAAYDLVDEVTLKKLYAERPFWYPCTRGVVKTMF